MQVMFFHNHYVKAKDGVMVPEMRGWVTVAGIVVFVSLIVLLLKYVPCPEWFNELLESRP